MGYIANALGVSFITSIMAIPILIVVKNLPDTNTFISIALVFVVTCSVLCSIFVPKVVYLKKSKKHGDSNATSFAHTTNTSYVSNSASIQSQGSVGYGGEQIIT